MSDVVGDPAEIAFEKLLCYVRCLVDAFDASAFGAGDFSALPVACIDGRVLTQAYNHAVQCDTSNALASFVLRNVGLISEINGLLICMRMFQAASITPSPLWESLKALSRGIRDLKGQYAHLQGIDIS